MKIKEEIDPLSSTPAETQVLIAQENINSDEIFTPSENVLVENSGIRKRRKFHEPR